MTDLDLIRELLDPTTTEGEARTIARSPETELYRERREMRDVPVLPTQPQRRGKERVVPTVPAVVDS